LIEVAGQVEAEVAGQVETNSGLMFIGADKVFYRRLKRIALSAEFSSHLFLIRSEA
jgi:hypothetical protein